MAAVFSWHMVSDMYTPEMSAVLHELLQTNGHM